MNNALEFEVPSDCSPEYLMSLMEPHRRAWLTRSLGGITLVLIYAGTSEDREEARAEIAAGLAEAGSATVVGRFRDEAAPNPADQSSSRHLGLLLPDGCSAEHIASLLPARREARPTSDFDGESMLLRWTGEAHDRDAARDEITAALAEIGIGRFSPRFFDDP